MNEKYYTPLREEFHVGFEFELNNYAPLLSEGWVKVKSENWFPSEFQILELKIRIKYLDKEDIEELGWKYEGDDKFEFLNECAEDGVGRIFNKLDQFDKYFTIKNNDLFYSEGGRIQINETNFTIKNKSELKKLMLQLGI